MRLQVRVLLFLLVAVCGSAPADADGVCDIALSSNAINRQDVVLTSKIAFEKKQAICQEKYSSVDEFKNKAKSEGFNLDYQGLGLGYSGGTKNAEGRLDFSSENFCSSDQESFASEYAFNSSVRTADIALSAWQKCVDTINANALFVSFQLSESGTGIIGDIHRTVSKQGALNATITNMDVQPNTAEVTCSIGGKAVDRKFFSDGGSVVMNETPIKLSCTKDPKTSVSVAFQTDVGGTDFITMPSAIASDQMEIDELNRRVEQVARDVGVIATRVSALEGQLSNLRAEDDSLGKTIVALMARLDSLERLFANIRSGESSATTTFGTWQAGPTQGIDRSPISGDFSNSCPPGQFVVGIQTYQSADGFVAFTCRSLLPVQ